AEQLRLRLRSPWSVAGGNLLWQRWLFGRLGCRRGVGSEVGCARPRRRAGHRRRLFHVWHADAGTVDLFTLQSAIFDFGFRQPFVYDGYQWFGAHLSKRRRAAQSKLRGWSI